MCGICGTLGDFPERSLTAMLEALERRGPDGEGRFTGEGISLGMRRLAIIDLEGGIQPMARRGHVLVYNGELYNYRELRNPLENEGWEFHTQSDTEVVLAALALWGVEAFHKFRGMFALALWQEKTRRLLLARDHFGQKPLYWHKDSRGLLFASELKALLATGQVSRDLSQTSVARHFLFPCQPDPETIFRNVQSLPPGHFAWVESGVVDLQPYWRTRTGTQPLAEKEAIEEGTALLGEVMERHLRSDVPVGLFLSGGLDSNLIAAMASEKGHLVSASTVGFGEEGLDEAPLAEASAKALKIPWTSRAIGPREFLQLLPEIFQAMDQPTGDGFNAFLASRLMASSGVKVVLSGTGADELLWGYPWFQEPGPVGKLRHRMAQIFAGGTALSRLRSSRAVFSVQEAEALASTSPLNRPEWDHDGLSHGELMSMEMLQHELPYLLLRDTDVMSMWHSLEVRLPFLDVAFAEWCMKLPPDLKFRDGKGKWILRKIALKAGVLPDVVHGPKRGFIFPLDTWLRNEFRVGAESLLKESFLIRQGFLAREPVMQHWQNFLLRPNPFGYHRVWNILALELWVRTHLNGEPDAPLRLEL